ncbi:hypothetical protein, partial [Vibrio harveyi]|uniref:hypothetical protein n=1 Tax=Vibrio harveyi TaxID=669 RepID=UPI0033911A5D
LTFISLWPSRGDNEANGDHLDNVGHFVPHWRRFSFFIFENHLSIFETKALEKIVSFEKFSPTSIFIPNPNI